MSFSMISAHTAECVLFSIQQADGITPNIRARSLFPYDDADDNVQNWCMVLLLRWLSAFDLSLNSFGRTRDMPPNGRPYGKGEDLCFLPADWWWMDVFIIRDSTWIDDDDGICCLAWRRSMSIVASTLPLMLFIHFEWISRWRRAVMAVSHHQMDMRHVRQSCQSGNGVPHMHTSVGLFKNGSLFIFFFRFFIGRVRWMDAAWLFLSTSQTRFSLHFSSFHFRIYFFFSICVHKKKKVFLICALRMRENAIDLENKMLMLGAGCDSGWNYCVRQVWIIVQQFWITVDRRGGLP